MKHEKKMNLARQISAAETLLHRYRLRHLLLGPKSACSHALTPAQMNMIMTVHERGSMTLKELTQALGVKAPAASAMLDRLVEMKLLVRVENPKDRRAVLVSVSPEEAALIQEIERNHLNLVMALCDKLGDDYAQRWGDLSERLQQVLQKELGPS